MNQLMSKLKKLPFRRCLPEFALVAVYGVAFLIISYQFVPIGDDKQILRILFQYDGIRDTITNYYSTWGGRVIPTVLWLVFSKLELKMWMICNTLFFAGFAFALSKAGVIDASALSGRQKLLTKLMICSLFFLISYSTIFYSAFWYTGSFYYFWSVTCLLTALLPFKKLMMGQRDCKSLFILYTAAAVYASYFEQTAVIMLAFGAVTFGLLLIKKKKPTVISLIYYLIILVNSMICLLAPGTHVRFISESITWYPDFDMLTIPDKLFKGLCATFGHLYSASLLLMMFICLLVLLIQREKYKSANMTAVAAIPLAFASLNFIPFNLIFSKVLERPIDIERTIRQYLFNFSDLNFTNEYSLESYAGIVAALTVTLFIAYLLFTSFRSKKHGLYCTLFYLAAFCSDMIISFSPTIYASGNRVFFVSDVLLIVVAACLLYEFLTTVKKGRLFSAACLTVFAISSLVLLTYVTQMRVFHS